MICSSMIMYSLQVHIHCWKKVKYHCSSVHVVILQLNNQATKKKKKKVFPDPQTGPNKMLILQINCAVNSDPLRPAKNQSIDNTGGGVTIMEFLYLT